MNDNLLPILGVSSGVLYLVSQIPYIRDIFRHNTKPQRATYWIWLVLNVIAFFAQLAAHASWSLYFTGAQLLIVLSIAILSLHFGYGKFSRRDAVSLLIALGGLVIWKLTKSPLIALLVVVGIDAVGFWLTLTKTWTAPRSETLLTWCMDSAAALLGVLSVGSLSFTKLVYPLYIMLGNMLLAFIIVYRRRFITRSSVQ